MEKKIIKHLTDFCGMKKEEILNLQLSNLLSFLEMKDLIKYKEFKKELRKEGWII